jgi:phenylacetic acid degradation operon negative regulatory protein
VSFEAHAVGEEALLRDFAAQVWDLEPHAAAYRQMLALFAPVEADASSLSPESALAVRLLLVDAWRAALLRDPRLPAEALPDDWPGWAARGLFGRLYRALSPAADSAVAARFEGGDGLLPRDSDALVSRRVQMDAWMKTDGTRDVVPRSEFPA